jgi:hypothetical protein
MDLLSLNTEETLELSKVKLPKLYKIDCFELDLKGVEKERSLFSTFECFRAPEIRYFDYRQRHLRASRISRKEKNYSPAPDMLRTRAESRFSRILGINGMNSLSLSSKNSKKNRRMKVKNLENSEKNQEGKKNYFHFDVQPKVIPTARPKLNLAAAIPPAISFGEKLWRLSQLAGLD